MGSHRSLGHELETRRGKMMRKSRSGRLPRWKFHPDSADFPDYADRSEGRYGSKLAGWDFFFTAALDASVANRSCTKK